MFIRHLGPGVCRRLLAAALFVLPILAPTTATAQQSSAAERAAQLNEEGKRLWMDQNDLPAAVEKFRQATALSPEGRYYFNLCYALHQLGRYREALPACEAVEPNGADEKVVKKARVVIDDLRKRLPAEPPDPGGDPGTGPDPDAYPDPDTGPDPDAYPDPNTGYAGDPGDGPPPGPLPGLHEEVGPADDYNWSLGADLGFLGSTLGNRFSRGGGFVKLHADFMWLPDQRMGVQGYIHIAQLGAEADAMQDNLEIVDIGGALYKHIPLRHIYLTPLVGLHISGLQPASAFDDPVLKVGLRTEVAASWLLGASRNHVISVIPTINFYSATQGSATADFYGLDKGGVTMGLTVGYTMRFQTPFGRVALFTLE